MSLGVRLPCAGYAVVAGVLAVVGAALAILDPDPTASTSDYVTVALLFAVPGTLVVAFAVTRQSRASRHATSRARIVAGSAARSLLAASAWLGVITGLQLALDNRISADEVVALGILLFLIVQCIVAGTIALTHLESAHRAREHALTLQAAAGQAQLQALRHQLDPHFLFNALNTIATLVREDAVAAERALASLAQLLRHSLATDDAAGTVAHELAVIRALAALARARFEDDVQIAVDAADLDLARDPLPPFLVQPLVENAIKHGMRTAVPPVAIHVAIARCAGGLAIDVANDGRLDGPGPGDPIGLGNLRARLALLYPQRHTLELEQRDGRVYARMRLLRAA